MFESWIHAVHTDVAHDEEPAATRDRLKEVFARGATRRMTQLGMLVGAVLKPLEISERDAVIYASNHAETRALEAYLDGFPTPSPTLFQTSIHPSAVQQALIGRQQPVGCFIPMTGGAVLIPQAIQTAVLSDSPRTILCGGEERGTWLLERGKSSLQTYAFALSLSAQIEGAIGRIRISATSETAWDQLRVLTAYDFCELLADRKAFDAVVAPGRRIVVEWL